VGWPSPTIKAEVKPRLAQPGLLHYEKYGDETWHEELRNFDAVMDRFYAEQELVNHASWSRSAARRVASVESLAGRHVLREVLEERGFGLK